MKKWIISLLLALALACSLMVFQADAAEIVDGGTFGADGANLTWSLDSDGVLTISGEGEMVYSNSSPWNNYNSSIKSVVIHSGVTNVHRYAFSGCGSLTSVMLPDTVDVIEESAFMYCFELATVTMPNRISRIEYDAFYGCIKLSDIRIPDGITSIGPEAFARCNFETVVLPNTLTTIGYEAFCDCNNLKNVTIPESVTIIGTGAFMYTGLTSIFIPAGVTSIGDRAFWCCDHLSEIQVSKNNPNFKSDDGVLFNKTGTELIVCPCAKAGDYQIPDTVTRIGDEAFFGCHNLERVSIPGSVTSIGENAFYGCQKLTSMVIPDGVTTLPGGIFEYCTSLTDVTLPENITVIPDFAFFQCVFLESVNIPSSVTEIRRCAFKSCGQLKELTIPYGVTTIGNNAFWFCCGLSELKIPDTVTSIGDSAFYGCSGLKTITIPNQITKIETSLFNSCSGLTSIRIPESVTSIGQAAFKQCENLKNVYYQGSEEAWNNIQIGSYNNPLTSQAAIHYNATWESDPELARLKFEQTYSCLTGQSVTVTAVYTGATAPSAEDCIWTCTGGDSVSFSDTVIADPSVTGAANTYWISNTVTLEKQGKFNIMLSVGDVNAAGTIESTDDAILSTFPANGATDVDYACELTIVFPHSAQLTGKGNIYIYDAETNHLVRTLSLDAKYLANESNMIFNQNAYKIARERKNQLYDTLIITLLKNYRLSPGTTYQIAMDAEAIQYVEINSEGDPVLIDRVFTGIQKGDWSFTTVDLEYPKSFNNPSGVIADSFYELLLKKPGYIKKVKEKDDGSTGWCYGTNYLVYAWKYQYPYLKSLSDGKNITSFQISDQPASAKYSIADYIQFAHLYQYTYERVDEEHATQNKYQKVYEAICGSIDGTRDPIILKVRTATDGSGKGHALIPLKILSETDRQILVQVYDCNYEKEGHIRVLPLFKDANGKICGFEYHVGSITIDKAILYSTASNLLDMRIPLLDSEQTDSAKSMVSSSTPLSNDKLMPIMSSNGASSEGPYLYWTDAAEISSSFEQDNHISITDGYQEIGASVGKGAAVSISLDQKRADITSNGDNVNYTLEYAYSASLEQSSKVSLSGFSSGTVTAQNTDDGVVISTTDDQLTDVSVTVENNDVAVNTTTFTPTSDAVNVVVDEQNTIIVQEDQDQDGAYETVIAEVVAPNPDPLTITTQPANYYGLVNSTARFIVKATGDGLTYQWQLSDNGGQKWTNSSVKTAEYSTKLTAARDGRMVRCIVTDQNGNSVISDSAVMKVRKELTIIEQPVDYVGPVNSTAAFLVEAVGDGLTYQWQFSDNNGKKWTNSSAKTAVYSTKLTSARDGRLVRCVVTDINGNSVTSDTAVMKIRHDFAITAQPKNYTGKVNSTASFYVTAVGDGLTYQWQLSDNGGKKWTNSSVKSAEYSSKLTKARDGRLVRCIITDAYGSTITSEAASMQIKTDLKITTQPKDYVGKLSSSVTFTVVAQGDGLTYQWQFSDNNGGKWTNSSEKSAVYTTKLTSARNGRLVRCIVTDASGSTLTSNVVSMKIG